MQSFLSHRIVASPSRDNLAVMNSTNSLPTKSTETFATAKAFSAVVNANSYTNAILDNNTNTNTHITASLSIGSVWSGPSDSFCPNEGSMASANFKLSTRNAARVMGRDFTSTSMRPTALEPMQNPFQMTATPHKVSIPRVTDPPVPTKAKDAFDTESDEDSPEPTDCCFDSPPQPPQLPPVAVRPAPIAPVRPAVPPALQMTSFLQPTAVATHPHQRQNPMSLFGSQLRQQHIGGESMMSAPPRSRLLCNQSQSRGDGEFSNESRSPLMSLLSFTVSTDRRPTFYPRDILAVATAPYMKPSKLSHSRLDSQPLPVTQHCPQTLAGPCQLLAPANRDPFTGKPEAKLPPESTTANPTQTHPHVIFAPQTHPLKKKKEPHQNRITDGTLPASPSVSFLSTLVPYTWLEPPMYVVGRKERGRWLELTPSLAEEWTTAMKAGTHISIGNKT